VDATERRQSRPSINTLADGFLEQVAAEDYAILIDGRWNTFKFTRQHLKRNYKVTANAVGNWELFEASAN
jgi:hypothetical protein